MCFTDDPEPLPVTQPPEVLKQSAPDKKTAAQPSTSKLPSIGTKKYRNESGVGTPGVGTKSPTGVSL